MTHDSGLALPPTTSASQLVAYVMCPRTYEYSYVLGLEPEFRSLALVVGSAMHATIGWWHAERLAGRVPALVAVERVLEADLLAETLGAKVRWKDQTPESLEADAKRLLRVYLTRFGDMPVATVEEAFTVELASDETGEVFRPLRGYLDLRRQDDVVVELKTAAKGWDEFDLVRHLQVGAYLHAEHMCGVERPTLEVVVMVKLKREPRIETYSVSRTCAENRWWRGAATAIESAILARQFPPKPSPLCRECEYERACRNWAADAAPREAPVGLPAPERQPPRPAETAPAPAP
ncbi:MAG: PD-(D/E)XK nuclease family protein [Polyangiaceae bacterium]|nr:PD-(D/E)XK nuclease family protein [Polyangiaceae bacterium]